MILSSYNWGEQQISILLYKFLMPHKWMVTMIKTIWWEMQMTRNKFKKKENENISLSIVSDCLWLHGLYLSRLLCSSHPLGKNTGVGNHFLGSFPPRDQTRVFCIAGRFFTEPPGKPRNKYTLSIISTH